MIPSSEAPGNTSTPMKRSSCLLILGKKKFQIFSFESSLVTKNSFANLVVFSDFTDEVGKSFIDIDPLLGWRFNKLATKVSGEIATFYKKENPLESSAHWFVLDIPFMPTWRSYSKSHLFATTMTGNVSWSLTRRICWWNKLISSNELREVML